MKIELINGHFNGSEAIELLTHLIHIKIKFHENKIKSDSNEEDIKYREKKIIQLQKNLFEVTRYIKSHDSGLVIQSDVNLVDVNEERKTTAA